MKQPSKGQKLSVGLRNQLNMGSPSIEELLTIIDKQELLKNLRILSLDEIPKGHGATAALEGSFTILGQEFIIIIGFDEFFPIHKPQFFLKEEQKKLLPHISSDGFVCFVQEEDLIIDYTNIEGIIEESFNSVIKELTKGITNKNQQDFVTEFEVYWARLKSDIDLYSLIKLGGKPRFLPLAKFKKSLIIGETENAIKESFITKKFLTKEEIDALTFKKALYVPLKSSTILIPPTKDKFWSNSEIVDFIFQNVDLNYKKGLFELLKKYKKVGFTVIVDLPINKESSALFGISFNSKADAKPKKHPLLSRENKFTPSPINVFRFDKNYILPRGGASLAFSNKSVLLVGCGAVGSVIAEHLIKSGIINLALIDNDYLKVENTYRHKLGLEYLHKNKAEALKEDLEKNLVYSKITAYPENLETFLKTKSDLLENFDLIFSATANPTINLFLNEFLNKNKPNLPVIFSWIDPYGIGGHAQLSNNNGKGCYNCLYSEATLDEGRFNRASFAKKDQTFGKTISGCGSTFTPFGALDAVQTAVMAVKLALSVLQKKEEGNPIFSWKGDPIEFAANGYELSNRYFLSQDQLETSRYDYDRKDCVICNKP